MVWKGTIMAYVEWEQKYSVGIPSLDTHHKKLFSLLNDLDVAMQPGQSADKLHAVIKELISYTQYHFEAEETIMKNNSYPEYGSHLKEHFAFIKKVKEVTDQFHNNGGKFTVDIKKFLKDWLSDHIMVNDQKYGTFLSGKGIA